jgi:hypothetical protein
VTPSPVVEPIITVYPFPPVEPIPTPEVTPLPIVEPSVIPTGRPSAGKGKHGESAKKAGRRRGTPKGANKSPITGVSF